MSVRSLASRYWHIAVVTVVAFAVTAPSLGNGFTYDDIPIIAENQRISAGTGFVSYLGQPYWAHRLYRPLTIWMFSLEHGLGGGHPLPFHAVNVILAMTSAILLLLVARAWLPAWAALAAALAFAVHPVHVEATASGVGQSELLVAVLTLAAVLTLQRAATSGASGLRHHVSAALLVTLAVAAPLAKENGFTLPLLLALVAVALTLTGKSRIRPATLAALVGRTVIAAGMVFLWRASVLGSIVGEQPAPLLQRVDTFRRLLLVVGLVPEWFRLLLWPAHLQAEYGPPGHGTEPPGAIHVIALALLLGAALLAWYSRRREPVVVVGMLWAAIALLPVSNVVPTGVVLAERTLFLPSIGVCLALGGLAALIARNATQPVRQALTALGMVLLAVAAIRSAMRARVWRDNEVLFTTTVKDAPNSSRAFKVYARYLTGQGRDAEAEAALRHAVELWNGDPDSYADLTLLLRRQARCEEAVPILTEGLRLHPAETLLRARLFECQLKLDLPGAARATANGALQVGDPSAGILVRRADSALAVARASGKQHLDASGVAPE